MRALACAAGALLMASAPLGATEVAQADAATHVVQPDETLWQIADAAGTDANTLAQLNGIDDPSLLHVGQTLKLPGTTSANASYTVVDGDTLSSIAQQFGTTTTALVQANGLDDADHLVVGTTLRVPSGATGSRPVSPAATPTPGSAPAGAALASVPSTPTTPGKRTVLASYTVQPGETLYQIARTLDVTADAIAQASGLDDPSHLAVGTVLKVPVAGREHAVQPGETLSDIAAQEKVDLGSLVDFNGLDDPGLIHVGQVLLVPSAPTLQAARAPTTSSTPAPTPTTTTTALPAASPAPTVSSTPTPTATATGTAQPTSKPALHKAAQTPPPGAPGDGLAGLSLKLLGAPYVWGGSSPSGFDCSGFIWYVVRQANKTISRGLLGQYNSGPHPGRDELKAGDLVFFQNTYSTGLSHNGVYIGNGQFVHAADETSGVVISSLGTAYWSSHWFGATRLP